ncbi:2-dehydropantoate 2-reductase [Pontibacillus halophilus JSM 076056 = DSM 19796]|uniref:2-dehydropantoate 2-reductase n=1 Tax=Pontibacillus halophilus JSM 076056 = DSM 19796 TaxID=1385510 RepID=A0A0A5GL92_9BACI|nr:2-dehydropantoate 2-reductase [Pontibacillus halophilus]KGX94011.1 2-dehydropantoate 2-reductase [Pontibacillus halophilus JSM 076056 = DSM 19796]
MNITILGAGALGAYFGARWQEAGAHVQFLVRPGRARQLRTYGMHVVSVHGDVTIKDPTIVEKTENLDETDLVVVGVKGYHLQGALPTLKTLVEGGAKVLPLLNGIEHLYTLQKELGEENVLGGLSYIIATLDDRGHVVHTSDLHDIHFGPLHPSQHDVCRKLTEVSNGATMRTLESEHILTDMWQKYMFITAFSGITTASDLEIGKVRAEPSTLQAAKKVLQEMKQLALGYEIPLTDKHVAAGLSKIDTLPAEATSSMHQDKRKGLPLEVDHLHGGALRLAENIGISLPSIEMIHALIKPYERGD